jgi:hypothetical protein
MNYEQEILNIIKPLYNKANQRKENLAFFKALNFISNNSAQIIEIGQERLREGKSHELREDFRVVND